MLLLCVLMIGVAGCDICCLLLFVGCFLFFFFKQKTAYEMRISDWSSDVCSSDLSENGRFNAQAFVTNALKEKYLVLNRDAVIGVFGAVNSFEGDPRLWEIGRASCRERVCQYV